MRPPQILAISASRKSGQSASRALLWEAVRLLGAAYPSIETLDLRDVEVPLFAGHSIPALQSVDVGSVLHAVGGSAGLLMSVPCYWSSVSGVFKNLVDVLCGAAYDLPDATTVFSGKVVGLIVVGADQQSAEYGHSDARRILSAAGASVLDQTVVIANPRNTPPAPSTRADLATLVSGLAKRVLVGAQHANE